MPKYESKYPLSVIRIVLVGLMYLRSAPL